MVRGALALLVHSHPLPVGVLQNPLREIGVRAACCYSRAQLEKALKNFVPQLVFTDLKLRDGTWFDVVRIVGEASTGVKVIVVGRKLDGRLEQTVRECGAYGYVAPPIERVPFHLLVSSALKELSTSKHRWRTHPAA